MNKIFKWPFKSPEEKLNNLEQKLAEYIARCEYLKYIQTRMNNGFYTYDIENLLGKIASLECKVAQLKVKEEESVHETRPEINP